MSIKSNFPFFSLLKKVTYLDRYLNVCDISGYASDVITVSKRRQIVKFSWPSVLILKNNRRIGARKNAISRKAMVFSCFGALGIETLATAKPRR